MVFTQRRDRQLELQADFNAQRPKDYHGKLNTYIQYGKLDYVMVILYDSYGNRIMSEYWQKPVEPEPEKTETEE